MNGILCIGDCHFPWASQEVLEKIYKFAKLMKPKYIIQMGDLYDCYSSSRFPRTLKGTPTPEEESLMGRSQAEVMWKRLQKASPKACYYQIKGNHDERPLKRIRERVPELEHLFDVKSMWKFPKVKTIFDSREALEIENIIFVHGWATKLGTHAAHFLRNTVVGHSHRGGCVSVIGARADLWELNAGYIGDPDSVPFAFTANKVTKWTQGFGYIDEYGPRFIKV